MYLSPQWFKSEWVWECRAVAVCVWHMKTWIQSLAHPKKGRTEGKGAFKMFTISRTSHQGETVQREPF